MRKFLLLICLVALTALSAAAQEEESPEGCDAPAAIEVITELAADDQLEPMDILRAIRDAVTEALVGCEGLSFTSEDHGLQPVIGPVSIAEGLYRTKVVTDGAFILHADVVSGECGEGSGMSPYVMNVWSETAIEGIEIVFYSTGCDTLLTVSNTNSPWFLTFEKLR